MGIIALDAIHPLKFLSYLNSIISENNIADLGHKRAKFDEKNR